MRPVACLACRRQVIALSRRLPVQAGGVLGQFWKMRDVMAAKPDKLDLESLVPDAGNLKLDVPAFRACVESDKTKDARVVPARLAR